MDGWTDGRLDVRPRCRHQSEQEAAIAGRRGHHGRRQLHVTIAATFGIGSSASTDGRLNRLPWQRRLRRSRAPLISIRDDDVGGRARLGAVGGPNAGRVGAVHLGEGSYDETTKNNPRRHISDTLLSRHGSEYSQPL